MNSQRRYLDVLAADCYSIGLTKRREEAGGGLLARFAIGAHTSRPDAEGIVPAVVLGVLLALLPIALPRRAHPDARVSVEKRLIRGISACFFIFLTFFFFATKKKKKRKEFVKSE